MSVTLEVPPLLRLAAFVDEARTGIPEVVAADTRDRVLDLLGNSLAARADDTPSPSSRVAGALGDGRDATSLVGGVRLPAASAALVNGTLAHALDFDDTHLRSVLHPSASVIPAALAVAEARGSTGAALLGAVAAGIEVCVRLGDAGVDREARSSAFFDRGFHATSICGAVGAAGAAASLMGLAVDRIGHAMAIACSMGAGILEANRTGGTIKRAHCGWAAHAGIVAALLAEEGVDGPPTALDGRFGFLRAHLEDRYSLEPLTDELGDAWRILEVAYKPYPTNHFTHAVIDAAVALRRDGLRPADVATVELGLPAPTLRTVAEPVAEKSTPRTGYAARFSAPYMFATALAGGHGLGVGLEDLTDAAATDPARLRLASRVTCLADEEASSLFPDQFGAVARVQLVDGSRREVRVASSRGGPGNRLDAEELDQKFVANLEAAGLVDRAAELRDRVAALGCGGDARTLMAGLTEGGP